MEWPHPYNVSTRRDRHSVPHRGWKAGAGRGAGIREQVRRLGCLTPHNLRLQPGAMGCRHPMTVPLAFGDSEQFDGLARFAVVDAFQRRLPGRCGVPARNSSRPPPLLPPRPVTRGACRSRLGGLPAHTASRARPPPKTMRTVRKVVDPPSRPQSSCLSTPRKCPLKSGLASL